MRRRSTAWCRSRTAARRACSRAISRGSGSWATTSMTCMAKSNTTRNPFFAIALLLASTIAVAGKPPPASPEQPAFWLPSDKDLLLELPDRARLETRRDGDINGDGIPDVAFVGGNDDARWLVVKIGYKDELEWGFEPASVYKRLDPYPLGAANLSVK